MTEKSKMDQLRKEYAQACKQVENLAEIAGKQGLWQKNEYGKRLSDLYLRLKQGPVRAVVIGQTSSGKSTLFNALAGDIIAPEDARSSSPIPLWMLWKNQKVITVDNQLDQPGKLPKVDPTNPSDVLTRHHVTGMQTNKEKFVPYVYTGSTAMPRYATMVDSPGFNANGEDTDKALSLFNRPSYATEDEPDLPELLIYVQSNGNNLSQEEMDDIRMVMGKGVDLERIFLVHNDIRSRNDITEDTFETLDEMTYLGLAQSYMSLALPKNGDDASAKPLPVEKPSNADELFTASEEDLKASAQAAEDADAAKQAARAHVLCVNMMIARLHYAGLYDPLAAMPTGVSQEERDRLIKLADQPKQDAIKEVCDDMKQKGHKDYQPMITLRDTIDAQALQLVNNPCLRYALNAVQAMGEELEQTIRGIEKEEREKKRKKLSEEIEHLRELGMEEVKPLETLKKDLQDITQKMNDLDQKRKEFSAGLGKQLTKAVEAQEAQFFLLKDRMNPASNVQIEGGVIEGVGQASLMGYLAVKFVDQAAKQQRKRQYEQVRAEFDRLYTFTAFSQNGKRGELETDVCRKLIAYINEKQITQNVNKKAIEKLANAYCADIKQGSITKEVVEAINQRIKQNGLLNEWTRKNDNFYVADPPVKDGSGVTLTGFVFSQKAPKPREFETDLAAAFGWLFGAAGPLKEAPDMPERVEMLCVSAIPKQQGMLVFKPGKVFEQVVCPVIGDAVDYTVALNQANLESRRAYLENNNFFGVRSYIANVKNAASVWMERIEKAIKKCRDGGGSKKEQIEQLEQELKKLKEGAKHGQGRIQGVLE